MIRPVRIPPPSPFLEEACALCKQPFAPNDEVVVCPVDEARHHVQCWRANHNKCSAFGCRGQGEVAETAESPTTTEPTSTRVVTLQSPSSEQRSKIITMPSTQYGCGYNCLLISIAITILIFAFSCFGLWLIADSLMGCGTDYIGPFCIPPTPTPLSMIFLWL